jgi:hypothetical protein
MLRQYLSRLVVLWMVGSAVGSHTYAAAFMDIDAIGVLMNKDGTSSQRTYAGTFNISVGDGPGTVTIGAPYANSPELYSDVAGYSPSQFTITSATAYFYVRDEGSDSGTEEVRIEFIRGSGDDGSGGDYDFDRGQISNRSFTLFDGNLNSTVIGALEDGVIQYTLEADRGDFVFDFARLEVFTVANPSTTGSSPTTVPEPAATAGWVTASLLAIAALRARRRVMQNR